MVGSGRQAPGHADDRAGMAIGAEEKTPCEHAFYDLFTPSPRLPTRTESLSWRQQKGSYIPVSPDKGGTAMTMTKHHLTLARTLGVAIIATVGLGGCATYKDCPL